jgi:hypothetical protein
MLVFDSRPATRTLEYFRTFSLSDISSGLFGKNTRGVTMCVRASLRIAPLVCGRTLGTRSTARAG